MTTTLRPTEPLQREADGTRSRRFQVCVNSRPVGAIHLGTSPYFGDSVAQILDLRIEEPDRRRGRGTVAALAAEEVVRGWGCDRMEVSVPAEAEAALKVATALGYVVRNRHMEKLLGDTAPELPAGSRGRPMTEEEYGPWKDRGTQDFAKSWIERGVPEEEAWARAEQTNTELLPGGLATTDMTFSVLEHEGTAVGTLWTGLRHGKTFVYKVESDARHRGKGHGRTLMLLAEAQGIAAGLPAIRLNVFQGNTPAERLYESLGYETVTYHLYKSLL
ncbi:Acetyltransferase (GNAT) family protein [Streptomyces sp. 3213]|uniref:GNAT family N-acetyltransferase n=1 Tax=Streptomyces sp. 3213.3 TaxID=1855348 RepID=UPI00089D70DB|nr:GNAT family N-acetyltransferase [Streptomyces sp. 3213.3]SED01704.1 Acetyltransferase (GNAT) family protein [Streptomyces sp. 3213] [Streptomyces sp. 3213.3]